MKKKRILCIEVSGECKNFANINSTLLADIFECEQGLYCIKNPVAGKPITKDACNNCKHAEYKGIPRSEAIERMAKALCRTYGEDCETCRFNGNEKGCKRYLEFRNYIAMAEAALNTLLEDK